MEPAGRVEVRSGQLNFGISDLEAESGVMPGTELGKSPNS